MAPLQVQSSRLAASPAALERRVSLQPPRSTASSSDSSVLPPPSVSKPPPELLSPPKLFQIPTLNDDGVDSHWGEPLAFELKNQGNIGCLSKRIPVSAIYLRWTPHDYDFPPHCAPRKQIIVCLNSQTQIQTSTKKEKIFGPGSCLLVNDLRGKVTTHPRPVAPSRHADSNPKLDSNIRAGTLQQVHKFGSTLEHFHRAASRYRTRSTCTTLQFA